MGPEVLLALHRVADDFKIWSFSVRSAPSDVLSTTAS
jgi:hypothetical protein